MIHVTEHCVERFHERVCPALPASEVRPHLMRLLADKRPHDAPEWVKHETRPWDAVVEISDGIVLGIQASGSHFYAVTCLTRGSHSSEYRAERNRRKARRRAARAHRRKAHAERKLSRQHRHEQGKA